MITGDLNSLWHRDSIDRLYEWLRRGVKTDQPRDERRAFDQLPVLQDS